MEKVPLASRSIGIIEKTSWAASEAKSSQVEVSRVFLKSSPLG